VTDSTTWPADIVRGMREASVFRHDLSCRQVGVLAMASCPPEALREIHAIASAMEIAGSAVSRAATKLQKLGLVRRVRNKRDFRRIHLVTTEDGEALLAKLRPAAEARAA